MPLKVVPRRDRKLYRFIKRAEVLSLKKGEVLYRAGDPSLHLFLVREGFVHLGEGHRGGEAAPAQPASGEAGSGKGRSRSRPTVLEIAGPWELFGEESLRPNTPRRLSAWAAEPSHVSVLAGPGPRKALQTSQKTFEAFLTAKEEDLALARALTASRRAGGAQGRVGALLLHLAARMGRLERKEGGAWTLPAFTHQLLADLSATHRSTVTTLLNEWIYQGVLGEGRDGLVILAPEVLGGTSDPSEKGPGPPSVR